MEPINKPERRKAYLNFAILFLVCTAIIITTVFFSTRMPLKQNDELLAYKKSVSEKNTMISDFTTKFEQASLLIDSLDKEKGDATLTEGKIDRLIKEMDGMFLTEEVNDGNRLYKNVTRNLQYYLRAKKSVQVGSDNSANIKELNSKIEQMERDNKDLLLKYIDCSSKK